MVAGRKNLLNQSKPDKNRWLPKPAGLVLLLACMSGCHQVVSADQTTSSDDESSTEIVYDGKTITILTNGEEVTELAADIGSSRYYRLDVPAGASDITFNISGGSGDADLYVKTAALPELDDFDCHPYQSGNEESCNSLTTTDTPYYLMIYAAKAYSGVTLLAAYTEASDGESAECVLTDMQQQLLDAHNAARVESRYCGDSYYPAVAELGWNCRLAIAAASHNQDMVSNNFFSHTGSNGSQPWDRMSAAGYQYSAAGENIAAGYTTVSEVMTGWLQSPGHCSNIMSAGFTEMGADMLTSSSADYDYYWTADFGRPAE